MSENKPSRGALVAKIALKLLPLAVIAAVMAATLAAFALPARSFVAQNSRDAAGDGIGGAIAEAGDRMAVMLGGSAALLAVCFAEGIALSVILDRAARKRGRDTAGASVPAIALLSFATCAAYFYMVML